MGCVGCFGGNWPKYENDEEGLRERLKNLMFLIPKNIVPWKDTQAMLNITGNKGFTNAYTDIMKAVHAEYFEENNSTCNLLCKTLLYSDNIMMQQDTNRWAQYRAEKYPEVPVYIFRFSLTSDYNPIRVPGYTSHFAVHGEPLSYFFYDPRKKQDMKGNGTASIALTRVVKMFTNFIKQGKPIPETDDLLPVMWEPNKSPESKITLLNIDEDLELRHEQLTGEHMDFWNELYAQYRKSDPPRVVVEQGQLEGEWINAATGDGFQFASFRGVPFAQPPTGNLRFRGPRPPLKWDGVKEAKSEKDKCVQGQGGGITGSEDCLYLSVFSPNLPSQENKELLPVVVFIHGGSWMGGDNSMSRFGPDYIVHEGIVMASLNYRLHAYGFLNLNNEDIPGNAAIKDLVVGVEWIYTNIDKFGGDPNRITIMGQSVGAASAHWLPQLPALNGKIKQAIIMSGSAYHSWAFSENNNDIAQQLGQRLSGKNTTLSTDELTSLFLSTSTEEFGKVASAFASEQQRATQPDLPFAPTREERTPVANGEKFLITRDAESYFLNREVDPIPTIMGVANREWTPVASQTFSRYDQEGLKNKLQDLMFLIPKNIVPWKDTQALLNITGNKAASEVYPDIMKAVHQEYFESTNNVTCDLLCKTMLYADNIMMQVDTSRWAQYRADKHPNVPTYIYRFSLSSDYNPIRTSGFTDHFATHGVPMPYLFHVDSLSQDIRGTGTASVTLRRVTKMFTNFVKYGQPVLQTDDLLNVMWQPNYSKSSNVTLLNIDRELTLDTEELTGEHMVFWNELYAKYRTKDQVSP